MVACIPAYNEGRTIAGVVVRAMSYVDGVLVCDDGSRDLTGEIAGGLGAVVVRHERNRGMARLSRVCSREEEMGVSMEILSKAGES